MLTINLKRFTQNASGTWIKNRCNISVDQKIHVNNAEYCLFAVIIHTGSSEQSGHYEVLINEGMKQHWNLYNDSRVSRVQGSAHLSKIRGGKRTAQYLFYAAKQQINAFFPFTAESTLLPSPSFTRRKSKPFAITILSNLESGRKIANNDFVALSDESEMIEDRSDDCEFNQVDASAEEDDSSDSLEDQGTKVGNLKFEAAIDVNDSQYERVQLTHKLKKNEIIQVIKFRFVNNTKEWLITWRPNNGAERTNWFIKTEISQEGQKSLTAYLRSNRALLQQGWQLEAPLVDQRNSTGFESSKAGIINAPVNCTPLQAFEMFFTSEFFVSTAN